MLGSNDSYKDKKVAIAGFAREGRSALAYFRNRGAEVTIVDEKESLSELPDGVPTILGKGAFEKLDGFDIVSRTASLNPRKIKTDGQITSVTKEFFKHCRGRVIGVTGTKGKGTTAALTDAILKEAKQPSHLVGNIGTPALDVLDEIEPNDIVVYELSSFQLWDIEQSPHVAVVVMVEIEHQDIHDDPQDYIDAKANISAHQTPSDITIFHPDNQLSEQVAAHGDGVKKRYLSKDAAYVKDGNIVIQEKVICAVKDIALLGQHNVENVCAAVSAVWEFTQDIDAICRAIMNFKGLKHRLEVIREVKGALYINDTISTTASSTVAALKSFDAPKILILGGFDRGLDYQYLVEEIVNNKVRQVIYMDAAGARLKDMLLEAGYDGDSLHEGKSMADIVTLTANLHEAGDVVLLSPAAASFGMFKNYAQRGEKFRELVEKL